MPEKPTEAELEAAIAAEEQARTEAEAASASLKRFQAPEEKERAATINEFVADEAVKARIASYKQRFPMLSEDDIREQLGIARDDLEEANKQSAIKLLVAAEKQRLRREEGLVTGASALDEMIKIVIECEDFQNPIILNGVEYWKTSEYTVPRHVANTILEMQDRGRRHERDRKGEKWDAYYAKPHKWEFSGVKGLIKDSAKAEAA